VEKPGGAGKTHRDCYEFYWSQSEPQSHDREGLGGNVGDAEVRARPVRHRHAVPGAAIRQRHVHYYFVYREKWVDVHISIIVPTKEDEAIFAAFDKSLRYGS
jgi:hypothetical protein